MRMHAVVYVAVSNHVRIIRRLALEISPILSLLSTMSMVEGSTNIASRQEEPLQSSSQQTFRSPDFVTGLQSATADQTLGQETTAESTAVNNSMIVRANGPYSGKSEQFLVSPEINAANKNPANTQNCSQHLGPNVALDESNTANSIANSSFLVTPGYRVTVFPWLR